ncbi:hypothetical protein H0H81_001932 [Sphagnurus paluster]|uniref:Uncharacterized protein n=1 Tax=Sphagnurus paluster TaxID=117069 RepID=A0A9P7G069_9AGAR|nr:hypothetical protein H0H81_001932 [Sphagnurus paluster]
MTIGIFLALLLITLVPTPPQANRAWRIFPVGFFTLGSAQFYSAWRGQVWMRGSTQLRVWEMQDMDAEANAFVDRILAPHMLRLTRMRGGASVADVAAPSPQSEKPRAPPQPKHDVAAIAPFTRPQRSSDTVPSYASSTTGVGMAKHHELHQFERPPVFGPEAVVLDPRIKAVHRQLMVEVCRFGIYFMLAFSALVFAVPSRL